MNSTTEQHPLLKKALWIRFASVVLIVFFLDVLTKFFFKKASFQTSGHFIDITFVQNTGTMWSLFHSLTIINILFIVFSILALALVVFFFSKYSSKQFALAFGFLSGGILGNLLDRILFGAVTDWINIHWWPIFNLADAFIVVGVIFAIYVLAFKEL